VIIALFLQIASPPPSCVPLDSFFSISTAQRRFFSSAPCVLLRPETKVLRKHVGHLFFVPPYSVWFPTPFGRQGISLILLKFPLRSCAGWCPLVAPLRPLPFSHYVFSSECCSFSPARKTPPAMKRYSRRLAACQSLRDDLVAVRCISHLPVFHR